MNDLEIQQLLVEKDDAFKELHSEHKKYQSHIEDLMKKTNRTDDDVSELNSIKKKKLMLKDMMQSRIEAYRSRSE